MTEDIDIDDLFNEIEVVDDEPPKERTSYSLPIPEISTAPFVPVGSPKEEIHRLYNRLQSWNDNCRDLFVDLRAVEYSASPDDSYIQFMDTNVYPKKMYFKVNPLNPKDEKALLAHRQFCKMIGVPHSFFVANRPSLKMNIVKTWQAGLAAKESSAQAILKIREVGDCSMIRAFIPVTRCVVPLHDLIGIVLESMIDVPLSMEFVYGDNKDDLVMHARFLLEKEYCIKIYEAEMPVCLGFSLVASELDAHPMSIDLFLHDKVHATSYINSYGGDPFFKSKYEGIKASQIKDIFSKMLGRIDSEASEMINQVTGKIASSLQDGHFCAESECAMLMNAKGFSSKIKKAVYHQIAECRSNIKNPWDLAKHVCLVAKDFGSMKRLDIERATGRYLNLIFGKE